MKTVLFIQPSLNPPGGGNSLACWMVESLKQDHEVTLLALKPPLFDAINRYFGTSLSSQDMRIILAPNLIGALFDWMPLPLALLKGSYFTRFASRHTKDYDLVITANNEMNMGRRGIQYVHYPGYSRPRPDVDLRWYHRPRFVLNLYYRLCDRIFAEPGDQAAINLTLVNSDWTGEIYRSKYGVKPRTLYPPVTGTFPQIPWEQRANGFVCLGRISPEKDIDRVIDILEQIRTVHADANLHVIGSLGRGRYCRRILRRIKARSDWITLHIDISHEEVRRLISENRYGLHGMENEHFGMAPAEMATGGCIVWVRDDGGQVEIVGGDERFIYHSTEDAVSKILATMENEQQQTALRALLAERTQLFSLHQFSKGVRTAVEDCLAENDGAL